MKNIIKKILHSTIAKIIIGIVVIIVANYVPLLLLNHFLKAHEVIQIVRLIVIPIIAIIFVLAAYIALNRYYEKRKITELSTRNIGKYVLIGLLLGLLIPSLSVLVSYLRGEYVILSISNLTSVFLRDLMISIVFLIAVAVFEEVLFRGVLFRLIEEKLGSYIAIIISGLLFGFAHLVNSNGSFSASLAISIISIFLIAAYMYTRNLWFPISIHFAWNFATENIFGTDVDVSGDWTSTSIIVSKIEGSKWFTGGDWGIEATVQAMVLCLIAGIILLVMCRKKGNILKPQIFKVKTD